MAALKELHFRHKDGRWDYLVHSGFPLLVRLIKSGKVDVVVSSTISVEEAEQLRADGFNLSPEVVEVVGTGESRRLRQVVRISRS